MNFVFFAFILTSPFFLHRVRTNSTKVSLQANMSSVSASPKQTSYFYQEPQGTGTYEFGYYVEDKNTENVQFRNETKLSNDTVTGSYGFLSADGVLTVINYIADENGYRLKKLKGKKDATIASSVESNESTTVSGTTTTTTTEIPGSLNLTSGTLPPILVEKVMDKFKIDLSPDASPVDILHPNISDIINGKVPLEMNENNSKLGFDVVQNFIPSNFPIVPFQLPTEKPNKSAE